MNEPRELILMVGGAVAAAMALVRVSLSLHRSLIEQFVAFLESNSARQEATGRRFSDSVDRLSEHVHENTRLLMRVAEQLFIDPNEGREE